MTSQRPASHAVAGLVTILLVAFAAAEACADLEFRFVYADQGVGFDDPISGPARKTALSQTADLVAGLFPQQNGVITLRVDGSVTEDSTLASAFSFSLSSCTAGFDGSGFVRTIAIGGQDPNGADPDGEISVNFQDIVWDLDDEVAANAFDFKSTMAHEILHALGFSGTLGQTALDGCQTGPPAAGSWDPFDRFVGDASGRVIDGTSAVMDAARYLAAVTGGTGTAGLLWHGDSGKAANNGQPIPLYSPSVYSPGSSIAHLDDDFYANDSYLMESATGEGPGARTLSPLERGIMQDLGYQNGNGGGGTPAVPALPLAGQFAATLAAGETNTYVLEVTQPGTLSIASSGDLDLVGALLVGGQLVSENDDVDGSNRNFRISVALTQTGSYEVRVRGYDQQQAGAYVLTTTFTPDDGSCPTIIDADGNLWDSTVNTCAGRTIAAADAQLYRAYSGAFARTPDLGGYQWWLTEIRAGRHTLGSMLAGFLFSDEFLGLVNASDGNSIDNAVFVNHVYRNVFGRAPDSGGFDFWFGELQSGNRSQARVLEEMTQSNEFVEKTLAAMVQFVESTLE